MKTLLNFLIEVGKLRMVKRRGVRFYGEKNPEATTDHVFRTAIIAWIFALKEHLNIEKVIKLALIHDLCEIYTGDAVPYEGQIIKDKKKIKEFLKKWPHFSQDQKRKKYLVKFRNEKRSLEKLIKNLPKSLKSEIMHLWLDYERGTSKEGRFVRETDRIENVLEAVECWKRNKKFPVELWWKYAEQSITDPTLLEFLKTIGKEELGKNRNNLSL